MSSAPLRVGLLGLGTVGQGVIRTLQKNAEEISRRIGRPVVVTQASARDLSRAREVSLEGIRIVSDPMQIVTSSEVDVVVEVIGGLSPARELILAALESGKPVVTANKALLALDGNTLFEAAQRRGVMIAFEASVAGGIPVIKAIREGLAGNQIEALAGIINGTCNYILTQMTEKGQAFAEALADAQRLGYAEADPTFDIEGIDAAHKLTILASIAFGMPLSFDKMAVEGITKVTAQDIKIAQALGYRIKHLGIAKRSDAGVELRAHPTLIPEDRLIAKVDGVLNTILLQGNAVGQIGLYGRGAGGDATASAVVADLVDVARSLSAPAASRVPPLAFLPQSVQELPVLPLDEVLSAHYLRITVADESGVLNAITAILADLDISIEAILQKEPQGEDDATIAVITSQVSESCFNTALQRVQELPFVRKDISRFRVEYF